MTKIAVVIPVFNEGKNLSNLIDGIKKNKDVNMIIVVDDGSKEKVSLIPGIILLRHVVNLGKGSAMKTGAVYAFANSASHVIFMDGDGQHRSSELGKFVKEILKGFDVVLGVRRVGHRQPIIRSIGNRIASAYVYLLFGYRFSDILSGYRALSHKAFVLTHWHSRRYGVETEMAARIGMVHKSLRMTSVPIGTIYKDKYKGVTIIDALNILFETIWWKLTWGYN